MFGGVAMTEEQRKARAEYKRRWRQQNPDKCRAYQIKFWTKKAEEYRNAEKESTDNQE